MSNTHFHIQLKQNIRDQNSSYFQQRHNLAPSGLRRGSAAAHILGLWVRIPPQVGCLSLVSVVLAVRIPCYDPIPRLEESY